jgi:hypothetical protein
MVINKKTNYGFSNLTNTVIIVSDITMKIQIQKKQPQGTHRVNRYTVNTVRGHLYITKHCLLRAVTYFPLMNIAYNVNLYIKNNYT